MFGKQLTFFAKNDSTKESIDCHNQTEWQLYSDGASRNNPGPAGIGFCLKKGDKVIVEQGFFIGTKTNNQAEYMALVIGLFFAKKFMKASDNITIFSDSQLLVRQMNGQYRVKDVQLKKFQQVAYDLVQKYRYSFCHIYRHDNTRADELANRGVDKKIPIPKKILDMLQKVDLV